MFFKFKNRFTLYRNAKLSNSFLSISWKTSLNIDPTSTIEINDGFFSVGFPRDKKTQMPSYDRSLIIMGKNSKIIINGNVSIASGCTIILKENAVLTFEGDNIFAHNCFFHSHKNIYFGKNVCSSWNCTFFDFDGHYFETIDHRPIKSFYKPLIVNDNVGFQMNVVIPRGVTVGKNSIISTNTTLRNDVEENTLAYSNPMIQVKNGYLSGLK